MKYRSRNVTRVNLIALQLIGIGLGVHAMNHPSGMTYGYGLGIVMIACLPVLLFHLSMYWQPTPEHLVIHNLWKRREIPWSHVREISWLGNSPGTLKLSVGMEVEDYEWIILEPIRQNKFIAELRLHVDETRIHLTR